jgi:transposase-like protein
VNLDSLSQLVTTSYTKRTWTRYLTAPQLLDTSNNWRCSFYVKKIYDKTKIAVVQEDLNGVESIRDVARKYNVSKIVFHRWVSLFNKHGEAAFQDPCTKYTVEFKMDVINYIKEIGASIDQAALRFIQPPSGIGLDYLKHKE